MDLMWNSSNIGEEKPELTQEKFFEEAFKFFSQYDNLIFKGAVIIYQQLKNEDANTLIYRHTRDVDFSNLGIDKERIKNICNEFVRLLDSKYNTDDLFTEEDNKTKNRPGSYTINWIEKSKVSDGGKAIPLYNLDFSVSEYFNQDDKYTFYNIEIDAYDINKTYSDKMMNISTRKVFSRFKDFIDLYNMSFIEDKIISIDKINYFCELNDKHLGNFEYMLEYSNDLFRLFSRMKRLSYDTSRKEEVFSNIYSRVLDFVTPYLPNNQLSGFSGTIWSPKNGRWENRI